MLQGGDESMDVTVLEAKSGRKIGLYLSDLEKVEETI
jgi:hypothetical protein